MACGRRGYVGVVRLEHGGVDVAAALDPRALSQDEPGAVVARLLAAAGLQGLDLDSGDLRRARWQVTPPLTRTARRLAGPGWIVVGDAAGFAEPFTGEGLSWALASGYAAGELPPGADTERIWPALQRELLARQRTCRGIAATLRQPLLVGALVALLSRAPGLAAPLLRRVGQV